METSRALAGRRETSSPPMKTLPEVGISRPAMRRRVVVLPHPLGPSRVTRSPAWTSKDIRSTATTGP